MRNVCVTALPSQPAPAARRRLADLLLKQASTVRSSTFARKFLDVPLESAGFSIGAQVSDLPSALRNRESLERSPYSLHSSRILPVRDLLSQSSGGS